MVRYHSRVLGFVWCGPLLAYTHSWNRNVSVSDASNLHGSPHQHTLSAGGGGSGGGGVIGGGGGGARSTFATTRSSRVRNREQLNNGCSCTFKPRGACGCCDPPNSRMDTDGEGGEESGRSKTPKKKKKAPKKKAPPNKANKPKCTRKDCDGCGGGGKVTVRNCQQRRRRRSKMCTDEYCDHCGGDGKTTVNACQLRRIRPSNICTDEYCDHCGGDGKTTVNACQLRRRNRSNMCTDDGCDYCGGDGKTTVNTCQYRRQLCHDANCKRCDGDGTVQEYACRKRRRCAHQGCECGGDGETSKIKCKSWVLTWKSTTMHVYERVSEQVDFTRPNGGRQTLTQGERLSHGSLVADECGMGYGVHITTVHAQELIQNDKFWASHTGRKSRHGNGGYFALNTRVAMYKLPRGIRTNLMAAMWYDLYLGNQVLVNCYGDWTPHLPDLGGDTLLVVGPDRSKDRVVVSPQECLDMSAVHKVVPFFWPKHLVLSQSKTRRDRIFKAMAAGRQLDGGSDHYQYWVTTQTSRKAKNIFDQIVLSTKFPHITVPNEIFKHDRRGIVFMDIKPAVSSSIPGAFHMLVIPTHDHHLIQHVGNLHPDDLQMIEGLVALAKEVVSERYPLVDVSKLQMGFHTPPSIWYLHMHVISSIEHVHSNRKKAFTPGAKFVSASQVITHLTPGHVYTLA